jgi:hypothetical protein
MKTFRKISFWVLTAIVFGMVLCDLFRVSTPFGPLFFLVGTISVFVLFIWAFVFLEDEPTLTRIALVILALCMAALCYLIATGPD